MIEINEKYQSFGVVPSPAACPSCGSMSLSYPFRGRRTGLWFSTCYDCAASVRSVSSFTVSEKYRVKINRHAPRDYFSKTVPTDEGMRMLRAFGESLFAQPVVSREPGEEG